MDNLTKIEPQEQERGVLHRYWLLGLLGLYVSSSFVIAVFLLGGAPLSQRLEFALNSNIPVAVVGLIGGLVVGKKRRFTGVVIGFFVMGYLGWSGLGVLP